MSSNFLYNVFDHMEDFNLGVKYFILSVALLLCPFKEGLLYFEITYIQSYIF